jgi:ORF6N domain-containing protein
MPRSSNKLTTHQLGRLIYEIRYERVMLDSDLAAIYGVETKALNRAVKRNRDRFPKDFVFQLSEGEEKLEVPNWHLKFGPETSISKAPN